MAIGWRYDLIDGFRVSVTIDGVEITRPAIASNIPVTAGTSDPEVLLKITEDSGFPGFFSAYPTTIPRYAGATLQDVQVVSRSQRNNSARLNLIYRRRGSDGDGSSSGDWSLEYLTQISHLKQYSTAAGEHNIQVWYKPGEAVTTTSAPSGASKKNVACNRMKGSAVLRATGRVSGAAWATLKPKVMFVRDCINRTAWGSAPRGTWYFPGPTTRTTDRGRSYTITLDFIEGIGGHFPIAAYYDEFGKHPQDCATESDLRSGGPPPFDEVKTLNGVSIASVYPEQPFSSAFAFTPDDA